MVLSFHPIFEGDENRICAGRLPDESDLLAIRKADIVVLPQGCGRELHEMARQNALHVFPDYDSKFQFPGKIGQIHLFQQMGVPHPETITCNTVDDFTRLSKGTEPPKEFTFPLVFKFNWGGEGDTVFLVNSKADFAEKLASAQRFEKSGQTGFLIQEYISIGNRVLRVVIIGNTFISYWRVREENGAFSVNLRENGIIDKTSDLDLQNKAVHAVKDFCKKTGINLAGFDILFSKELKPDIPLFLEINYFFGRKGLGGSEGFYDLLIKEIKTWIDSIGY